MAASAPPPRRTQAERRAASRAALLDAAVASLVEDGYAGITTRRIAERAGVSQGTQQHYFATKAELVVEALRHATDALAADAASRIDPLDLHRPDRHEALLDELWRLHRSVAFRAALELLAAARTDAELRPHVEAFELEVTRVMRATAKGLLPDDPRQSETIELMDLAMATTRGFAMLAPVVPAAALERRWSVARGHIATLLRAHVEAGPGAASA
jgi:AcrR family transcriptional regulator